VGHRPGRYRRHDGGDLGRLPHRTVLRLSRAARPRVPDRASRTGRL